MGRQKAGVQALVVAAVSGLKQPAIIDRRERWRLLVSKVVMVWMLMVVVVCLLLLLLWAASQQMALV